MTQRLEFIDFSKGIGILLVVLGHTSLRGFFSDWIWSFHMPLFFFLSGLFYRKNISIKVLLIKRFRSLLLPYLVFSLIVFYGLKMLHYEKESLENLFISGWNGIALWFIPVLLSTEIFFFITTKYIRKDIHLFFFIILCSLLGYFLDYNNIHFNYKQEVIFYAISYYGLGFLFNKYVVYIMPNYNIKKIIDCSLIMLFINITMTLWNYPKLDLAANQIGNYFLGYTGSISGIFMIILFSIGIFKEEKENIIMDKVRWALQFLGKNTFVILSFHQIISIALKFYIDPLNLSNLYDTIFRHVSMWIILIFLIQIINNFFPWILHLKK